MKAMNTIKKFGYKILRKFGIVGKEYQLLPSNFPVANINTTFNQIGQVIEKYFQLIDLKSLKTGQKRRVIIGFLKTIRKLSGQQKIVMHLGSNQKLPLLKVIQSPTQQNCETCAIDQNLI